MIHGIFSLYAERWPFFQELILQHIKIASTAILISGSIGLFLGILISEHRRFATWIIGVINVAYTIPSISMLGFLIPFTGIGNKTATIALTIYGLLPPFSGIASYIGAGGLGVAIYRGITTNNAAMTYAGSILIALVALASDQLVAYIERHIRKKWHLAP